MGEDERKDIISCFLIIWFLQVFRCRKNIVPYFSPLKPNKIYFPTISSIENGIKTTLHENERIISQLYVEALRKTTGVETPGACG